MPSLEAIEQHPQKAILSSEWENMLSHQLPMLKPFESFWNQLPDIFNRTDGKMVVANEDFSTVSFKDKKEKPYFLHQSYHVATPSIFSIFLQGLESYKKEEQLGCF